jgi:hypothetical protein
LPYLVARTSSGCSSWNKLQAQTKWQWMTKADKFC